MTKSYNLILKDIQGNWLKTMSFIFLENVEKALREFAKEYDTAEYEIEFIKEENKLIIRKKIEKIEYGWIFNQTTIVLVNKFLVELIELKVDIKRKKRYD